MVNDTGSSATGGTTHVIGQGGITQTIGGSTSGTTQVVGGGSTGGSTTQTISGGVTTSGSGGTSQTLGGGSSGVGSTSQVIGAGSGTTSGGSQIIGGGGSTTTQTSDISKQKLQFNILNAADAIAVLEETSGTKQNIELTKSATAGLKISSAGRSTPLAFEAKKKEGGKLFINGKKSLEFPLDFVTPVTLIVHDEGM